MSTGFKYINDLEKNGFDIQKLSQYHFRVNGRFDVFPTFRHNHWSWHDIGTNSRGKVAADTLPTFIRTWIEEHKPLAHVKAQYVRPTERGWWNCPIDGCSFKMRDDFTSESARRALEHLETH